MLRGLWHSHKHFHFLCIELFYSILTFPEAPLQICPDRLSVVLASVRILALWAMVIASLKGQDGCAAPVFRQREQRRVTTHLSMPVC